MVHGLIDEPNAPRDAANEAKPGVILRHFRLFAEHRSMTTRIAGRSVIALCIALLPIQFAARGAEVSTSRPCLTA